MSAKNYTAHLLGIMHITIIKIIKFNSTIQYYKGPISAEASARFNNDFTKFVFAYLHFSTSKIFLQLVFKIFDNCCVWSCSDR